MIRAVFFLALIALLALGAGWLIDRPGAITLVWQDWQIETSVPVALIGVLALAFSLLLIWWFFRTLYLIPETFSDFIRGRRRKRGLSAVAHGLVAIGVGDGRAARRSATEARRLIGDEPLTLLLRAQAAQLSGDRAEAEAAFRAMLEREETRPLGYRGLFVEARRRGDEDEALQIARQAAETDPKVPWAGPALLELQGSKQDWDGALGSVERNVRAGLSDRKAGRRQRAVLMTAKAQNLVETEPDQALSHVLDAAKAAPDLVPAAALAGRLLAEAGDYRKATKILEKAWRANPHPDLAEVYLHMRPGDAAADRLKRARTLYDLSGGQAEGAMVLGRAAIDAREFSLARQTLQPLLDAGASRRVCLLMAELDDAEYSDRGRARAWLTRALVAKPDPAWVADGVVSQNWQAFSPVNGRLDAFRWTVPVDNLAAPDSKLIESDLVETENAPNIPIDDNASEREPEGEAPAVFVETPPPVISAEKPADALVETSPTVALSEPVRVIVQEPALKQPLVELKSNGRARPVKPVPQPEIVLPLAHAPDDPGPDAEDVEPRTPVRIPS